MMPDIHEGPMGIANSNRAWGYQGGKDKNFSVKNHMAVSPSHNLLRNGLFESWSQGTTGRPDGWATNAVGVFTRVPVRVWGQYALKITKVSGDGAVSRIEQSIENLANAAKYIGVPITVTVKFKTDQGNAMIRPYLWDSVTGYQYGEFYHGADEWTEVWYTFSIVPGAAPTDVRVGVQVEQTASGSNVDFYVDQMAAYLGWMPYPFSEHPQDRAPISQGWDDDGTRTLLRGCQRIEAFKVSHTSVGGSVSDTFTYTLPYGCRQINSALAQVESANVSFVLTKMVVRCHTYTTTGFDITYSYADGANLPTGRPITFDGQIMLIGWDSNIENFK